MQRDPAATGDSSPPFPVSGLHLRIKFPIPSSNRGYLALNPKTVPANENVSFPGLRDTPKINTHSLTGPGSSGSEVS